ncbi:hypothetical protein RISK_003108 [Rhodopirellula islandica]|uniref:Uncharacterized protein n=1 Tax=Rhodopirellula islandica TaxID=595434 RepID=A0A0J1BE67_RHOIS|nr:hypothetical protein RISK_003108 [Rhodopirellula islandica]
MQHFAKFGQEERVDHLDLERLNSSNPVASELFRALIPPSNHVAE